MTGAESTDAEDDSIEQIFRRAPVRTTLAAIAFVNWFAFFVVSVSVGGDAIGTTPSTQGFVVESKNKTSRVSERVWVFALVYPLATLAFFPAAFLLLAATQARRIPRPERIVVIVFVLFWCTGWYWTLVRDGGWSIQDYRALKAR